MSAPKASARVSRHGFSIDFTDAAARDTYLADPAHARAGTTLVAALDGGTNGLIVFDLEV